MAAAGSTAYERYRQGFADRVRAMGRPGQEVIDAPGILGLVGLDPGALDGRILVSDDRAAEVLQGRLPTLNARVVYVFDAAQACRRILSASGDHRPIACTAMVREPLDDLPDLALAGLVLPDPLVLRPVATGPAETGVPLVDAAEAALRSEGGAAPSSDLADFVAYLRSVPGARYLAAVDGGGTVRATAAAAVWDATCGIFFVNTDPGWRGRGIGTAMTVAALRAAAADGAQRACLDASALGRSLYAGLGFESVGEITQYVRS
jgi:ribosomal protein S18 acetylase RimI-like enzyme